MQWIAVEESLPPDTRAVLIAWGNHHVEQGRLMRLKPDADGPWWVNAGGDFKFRCFGVTHWMPLPAHPIVSSSSTPTAFGSSDVSHSPVTTTS